MLGIWEWEKEKERKFQGTKIAFGLKVSTEFRIMMMRIVVFVALAMVIISGVFVATVDAVLGKCSTCSHN